MAMFHGNILFGITGTDAVTDATSPCGDGASVTAALNEFTCNRYILGSRTLKVGFP